MLRMALIASLIVFNLSVWIGPAEVLAARGKALFDAAPDLDHAQRLVLEGNIPGAAAEFETLVSAFPMDTTVQAEYGLFCFNNADTLQEQLGWTRTQLITATQKALFRARSLAPDDFSMASQYALTLMDEDFFGRELPKELVLESWEYVMSLLDTSRATNVGSNRYDYRVAHTYLQLARVAKRYDDLEATRGYVEQVLSLDPEMRIARNLLAP